MLVMIVVVRGKSAGANGPQLGVVGLESFVAVFAVLALPEALFAVTGSVVVRGGGAVAFVALVGAVHEEFEYGGDEEKEAELLVSRRNMVGG